MHSTAALWGTVRWTRPLDGRQGGLSASISIGVDLGDMAHPPVARLTLDVIVESKFCWLLSAATAHGLDPGGSGRSKRKIAPPPQGSASGRGGDVAIREAFCDASDP